MSTDTGDVHRKGLASDSANCVAYVTVQVIVAYHDISAECGYCKVSSNAVQSQIVKSKRVPFWLKPFRVIELLKLTLLRFAPKKGVLAAMLTVEGE